MALENITVTYKYFKELNTHELYAIMRLRSEVFVVEQNCVYLDADGRDIEAYHVMAWHQGLEKSELVGYARLMLPKLDEDAISSGRLCVSNSFRKSGLAYQLVEAVLKIIDDLQDDRPLIISAQSYLINFYRKLNFKTEGEEYLEDGLPHIRMVRNDRVT